MFLTLVVPLWTGYKDNFVYVTPRTDSPKVERQEVLERKKYWVNCKDYFKYLSSRKGHVPNSPEAYSLLIRNLERLIEGERIVWAFEKFEHRKAAEMQYQRFLPKREHILLDKNGGFIYSKPSKNSEIIKAIGGITDGEYSTLLRYTNKIVNATFGYETMGCFEKESDPFFIIFKQTLDKMGLPHLVLDEILLPSLGVGTLSRLRGES